ncbi:MAG: class I SAM-dependent methyltransferase [Candidatus Aminicenantes bacterium]|nr:class I SAM-dependent methyltransferase [Candidatus Aminicenantes bacterium]
MSNAPWQLRLVKKSIKKREKLRLLRLTVPVRHDRKALDLGCAQGILGYFARQRGGFWVHADEDLANLKTAGDLLGGDLVQLRGESLPFGDTSFDLILCLDYLEHVDEDDRVLAEIFRALKPGGRFIAVTPHTGPFFLLHKLRSAAGLRLEDFGHKREGYSSADLKAKLGRAGFRVEKSVTYSRFFSEFFELLLNVAYIKFLAPHPDARRRDGHIRPASKEEFRAQEKSFALYSLLYPFVWTLSRLDALLFFQKGYSLMVWAKKN